MKHNPRRTLIHAVTVVVALGIAASPGVAAPVNIDGVFGTQFLVISTGEAGIVRVPVNGAGTLRTIGSCSLSVDETVDVSGEDRLQPPQIIAITTANPDGTLNKLEGRGTVVSRSAPDSQGFVKVTGTIEFTVGSGSFSSVLGGSGTYTAIYNLAELGSVKLGYWKLTAVLRR